MLQSRWLVVIEHPDLRSLERLSLGWRGVQGVLAGCFGLWHLGSSRVQSPKRLPLWRIGLALRIRTLTHIGFGSGPDPCYGGSDPCHGEVKDS